MVSVPELWTVRDPVTRLVVGVDDTTGDHRLLQPAFALAAEREASLVVLHAWYIPSMYAEAMRGRTAVEEAREKTRFRIAEEMAVWQGAYPAVDAQLQVSHAAPRTRCSRPRRAATCWSWAVAAPHTRSPTSAR